VGYARLFARAGLAVTLLWSAGIISAYAIQFAPVLIGTETRDAFIRHRTRFYDAISWANSHLNPRTDRLLVLTHMTYYLRVPYVYWPGEFGKRDLGNCSDHHELYRRLKEMGITHVLIAHSEMLAGHKSLARIQSLLAELCREYCREVYRNNADFMGTRNPLDFERRTTSPSAIFLLR